MLAPIAMEKLPLALEFAPVAKEAHPIESGAQFAELFSLPIRKAALLLSKKNKVSVIGTPFWGKELLPKIKSSVS